MDIFSAAITLLLAFLCLVIFIPIIGLIIMFVGYDKFSPATRKIVGSIVNFVFKRLGWPSPIDVNRNAAPKRNKKVQKASSKGTKNEKPKQVEDAEFREVK